MKRILCVFAMLLFKSSYGEEWASCFYLGEGGELEERELCASLDAKGKLRVRPDHLLKIKYKKNGLQCVYMSARETYYVRADGKTIRAFTYDNGCDYFKEGLARTTVNSNLAYFNENLDVVINTEFDYGMPFYYGYAVVCKRNTNEGGRGESCGLIGKDGGLVVDARYSLDDRDVFENYINSHNECSPPPVVQEKDALCHAKRHLKHMEHFGSEWLSYAVTKEEGRWSVCFTPIGDAGAGYTVNIDSETARWISITRDTD